MKALRAAVIGVGEMGQHHARVYAEMSDVDLVAVADLDGERAENVTRSWGAEIYANYLTMLDEEAPDLASVCVPTVAHYYSAFAALARGVHVLVEKPITADPDEARALIDVAKVQGLVLAVGHIERCNPIVTEAKRRIDTGELGQIYRITTRRVGPSPERIRDVGCTIDLATHDLDIMRYLLQAEPVRYCAELQWNKHGEYDDAVTAIVRFEGGAVGVLEADWLSSAKDRTLTVTGENGVLRLSYLTQSGYWQFAPGKSVDIGVPYEEPLLVELRAFAAAARGEGRPAATGEDGLRALEMALEILGAG